MKNFSEFVAKNKKTLFDFAAARTKTNSKGQAVISRNDSWFNEDIWETDYKELTANEKNSSARSLVC